MSHPCTAVEDQTPQPTASAVLDRCVQDPAIVSSQPVLVKAAAGGQLRAFPVSLSGDSGSYKHSSNGSLIGTAVHLTADSTSGGS